MRRKSAIMIIDISNPKPNIELALDEDCNMHLVSNEKQALEFLKLEYSSKYVFYGLITDPTSIHKEFYNRRLKGAK
jgi:hypothetical protein